MTKVVKEAEVITLTAWDRTKLFFKRSETIFLARMETLTGFVIAAVGVMDWSPIMGVLGTDTGFSSKQALWLGTATVVKGLFTEAARRRNAPDLATV